MEKSALEREFVKGKTPQDLDGFYKGTLLTLFPKTPPEHLAHFLSRFFVPWRGKCFYKTKQAGDNILPSSTKPFIKLYPESLPLGIDEFGGYHAFPFKTALKKGLQNQQQVLQLSYDQPENPSRIRRVVDEIVAIDPNHLLGKVYLKEGDDFRLVGFFRLRK